MIEFGSDFHNCQFINSNNYFDNFGDVRYYASGRQALESIIKQEKWQRIWIPVYFCHEVVSFVKSLNIEVVFYDDEPLKFDDGMYLKTLPYQSDDVLLRVNYFGLREKRTNKELNVTVIEDHTHATYSEWSLNSDADWCIASLRKSLPVAAGGILWSPQNKELPNHLPASRFCEEMAKIRYEAMAMKTLYLNQGGNKKKFREKYITSEYMIETMNLSGMDAKSLNIVKSIDIEQWTKKRKNNWNVAYNLLMGKFNVIKPKKVDLFYPFSLVILCNNSEERKLLRNYLVQNSIYPAILWNIPKEISCFNALDFSDKMLSLHCDARYSEYDIREMCKIINAYYD